MTLLDRPGPRNAIPLMLLMLVVPLFEATTTVSGLVVALLVTRRSAPKVAFVPTG